ncbi:MAG: type IV pilus modification protein PilV [Halofilum sp. (in: g-proteobacteria)]|nr:type IV pilus modification protein PilV [Halofilum sp. (in: g-proteobacteria)]
MNQRGFGMLEVLITLLILAVGLLGLAGLQLRAQRVELEAFQRVQALILLEDMAARLRSNPEAARCYETVGTGGEAYVGTGSEPAACAGWGSISTRARADSDLNEWDDLLEGSAEAQGGASAGAMTGARGCVSYDTVNEVYTVSVAWQGETETVAPAVSTCGQNLYGNDALRRVVSQRVTLPDL